MENPSPKKSLAGIQIEATGCGRLAMAGETLRDGASHLLRFNSPETLKVILAEPMDAEDADASEDQGVIARRY